MNPIARDRALGWLRFFQLQDLVWALLFGTLIALYPPGDPWAVGLLSAVVALQIAEPKVRFAHTTSGRALWIALKWMLAYLLIGYTGAFTSPYYVLLLLPVVSAATWLGVIGTLIFSLIVLGSCLTFLLRPGWSEYWQTNPAAGVDLALHAIFVAMAANVANLLAQELRVQSGEYRKVAEQLTDANQSLRAAEEAVRRSDRLAALGQLSAGLAHELRTPLGTMKASAEMLEKSVAGENDVAREVAGFISSEVDRTNALVTRFLDFARPLKLRLAEGDLAAVLDRAVALVERDAAAHHVAVFKNYAPEVPRIPMDAELLERVFYNLLLNAIQATPERGEVTIKTRTGDGMVEVAVIDRGCGIEAAMLNTVFNPFVTSKPDGVGLGLAIVSKIVDEHRGRIAVESEAGKGSVFRVQLPAGRLDS